MISPEHLYVNHRLRKRVTCWSIIIVDRRKFHKVKGPTMKKKVISRNYSFWTGFAAALAAGVVASGVMLFLSISFGGVSLPETVGSELTALMPPPMFDYLHRTIGAEAKQIFFYGILVGQCLLFALSGALYNRGSITRTGVCSGTMDCYLR